MRLIFSAARWLRTALTVSAVCALAAFIILVSWARQVVPADKAARFALDSDENVAVNRSEWIVFRPQDTDPITGFIFYPGGKAEPAAYAPLLHTLAARGFLVVLCPMPLNLALLEPDCAAGIMNAVPEVQRWAIGGHSLGGVMAAGFAGRHSSEIAGLVLWAAYPSEFTVLRQEKLPVLVIYGDADTLTTGQDILKSQARLPSHTRYIEIPGGDHWGFGHFAPGLPGQTVSHDTQRAIVLDSTQAFLEALAPGDETP